MSAALAHEPESIDPREVIRIAPLTGAAIANIALHEIPYAQDGLRAKAEELRVRSWLNHLGSDQGPMLKLDFWAMEDMRRERNGDY